MICSRWDWQRLRYDYFRAPGFVSPGGWRALTGLGAEQGPAPTNTIGIPIELALPPLPHAAVYVGSGVRARGTLVRPKGQRIVALDGVAQCPDEPPSEHLALILTGTAFGLGAALGLPIGKAAAVALAGLVAGWSVGMRDCPREGAR